jgi:hypothetical protein
VSRNSTHQTSTQVHGKCEDEGEEESLLLQLNRIAIVDDVHASWESFRVQLAVF